MAFVISSSNRASLQPPWAPNASQPLLDWYRRRAEDMYRRGWNGCKWKPVSFGVRPNMSMISIGGQVELSRELELPRPEFFGTEWAYSANGR